MKNYELRNDGTTWIRLPITVYDRIVAVVGNDADKLLQIVEAYNEIEPAFLKIVRLVQDNPDFFDARYGSSSVQAAADYLERHVAHQTEPLATNAEPNEGDRPFQVGDVVRVQLPELFGRTIITAMVNATQDGRRSYLNIPLMEVFKNSEKIHIDASSYLFFDNYFHMCHEGRSVFKTSCTTTPVSSERGVSTNPK